MAARLFNFVALVCFSSCSVAVRAASSPACIGDCGQGLILYMTVQSRGILTLSFNPSKSVDESIRILSTNTDAGYLPGWITQYKDDFYTVSRTEYSTPSSIDGGVFAFHRTEDDGQSNLERLNSVSSGGQGGVYVDVSRDGRTISVANMFVIPNSTDDVQVKLTHSWNLYSVTGPLYLFILVVKTVLSKMLLTSFIIH